MRNNKIISGIILILAGLITIVFGKRSADRKIRIAAYLVAAVLISSGAYVFKLGLDDEAIGAIGKYKLDAPQFQTLVYKNKEDFKSGLQATFDRNPDTRRLHFKCPDDSNSFTVYNAMIGIFGHPQESATCKDGTKLLDYKN